MNNKQITTRQKDFSQWYQDIVDVADLAEHSPVRGCMVIKPYGYALWEMMQKILDEMFKTTGVENAYFPLFIPQSYLNKEKEHVEGFSPEVAVVTHAGGKKLDEPLVVRPTSETIIYEVYKNWVNSYRDLPILINQWANVVRWEMRTRLFLRTTEFLWQEGHTAHVSEKDAENRTLQMLKVYKDFAQDYLAIPIVDGLKTKKEQFAGALRTYSCEAMMQDGKALQFGTSHNLGQNFSKAFDIKYLDKNNKEQYVWQTSWGVSTRMIGGLIMAHSDDKGLVLPPKIAPIQVVIVLIYKDKLDKKLIDAATRIKKDLEKINVRVRIDDSHKRTGEKLYHWEKRGVPVRVEIGDRDIQAKKVVVARRDKDEKISIAMDNLSNEIVKILNKIQNNLFEKSNKKLSDNTVVANDMEGLKQAIKANKFVKVYWCKDEKAEEEIAKEMQATIRCMPVEQSGKKGKCIHCGKNCDKQAVFAKSY